MPDCPLGGECRRKCDNGCDAWADRARIIADGQEQPMEVDAA